MELLAAGNLDWKSRCVRSASPVFLRSKPTDLCRATGQRVLVSLGALGEL